MTAKQRRPDVSLCVSRGGQQSSGPPRRTARGMQPQTNSACALTARGSISKATSPISAPGGPTGERQEHLDAIVSFAGAGHRRRLFRELDILTIKWATGDLPEECRFLLNTQLMFLKKEKDPTSKQLDDDEWIRSLTEAQEVTTDVPEDSVTHDQQEADPQQVRPIQTEEFLRKYVSRRLLALSEGETTSMRQIGVGTPGGAEPLAIFHQLFCDVPLGTACQNQSLRKRTASE